MVFNYSCCYQLLVHTGLQWGKVLYRCLDIKCTTLHFNKGETVTWTKKDYENIANRSNFIHKPKAGCEVVLGTSLYARKNLSIEIQGSVDTSQINKICTWN